MPLRVARLAVRRLTLLSHRFFIRLLPPLWSPRRGHGHRGVRDHLQLRRCTLNGDQLPYGGPGARGQRPSRRLEQLVQAELRLCRGPGGQPHHPERRDAELQRLFFAESSAFTQIDLVDTEGQIVASSAAASLGHLSREVTGSPPRPSRGDQPIQRQVGSSTGMRPDRSPPEPQLQRHPGRRHQHGPAARAGVSSA